MPFQPNGEDEKLVLNAAGLGASATSGDATGRKDPVLFRRGTHFKGRLFVAQPCFFQSDGGLFSNRYLLRAAPHPVCLSQSREHRLAGLVPAFLRRIVRNNHCLLSSVSEEAVVSRRHLARIVQRICTSKRARFATLHPSQDPILLKAIWATPPKFHCDGQLRGRVPLPLTLPPSLPPGLPNIGDVRGWLCSCQQVRGGRLLQQRSWPMTSKTRSVHRTFARNQLITSHLWNPLRWWQDHSFQRGRKHFYHAIGFHCAPLVLLRSNGFRLERSLGREKIRVQCVGPCESKATPLSSSLRLGGTFS